MFEKHSFTCEEDFIEHPEFRELVEAWSTFFDDNHEQADVVDLDETRERVEIRAAEILEEHQLNTNSRAIMRMGYSVRLDELWTVRALTLAWEMRQAAQVAEPAEVEL